MGRDPPIDPIFEVKQKLAIEPEKTCRRIEPDALLTGCDTEFVLFSI